jgi:hypothetical protein
VFTLAWSVDHRRMIERIDTAVLAGGMFAFAMPRGSGKTTLAEIATIWATVIGAREFVCLIGSDESSAGEMLASIKTELQQNELLLADFPEALYPVHCLENISHRAGGQLCEGQLTHLGWGPDEIVLPTVRASKASGAIIRSVGLTGRIRGMKFKRPDGRSVRPSLVVIDDPQTDESARSPSQCQQRERIITGAILGLAGPGKKISGVMPCTVIQPVDLADRFLDRQKHPEWQGERTKLLYAFPTNERLWEQYAQLRADSLRAGNGGKEATTFYAANREAMDAGAEPAWPVRFNPDEISALQHAMNLRFDLKDPAFFAEYQNEPLPEQQGDAEALGPDEIARKVNGIKRGVVPLGRDHLTAYVDVQGKVLYWVVCAWSADFTGDVIDYGAYPEQQTPYFTLRDVRRTLQDAKSGAGLEAAIFAGLEVLSDALVKREWIRDGDGAVMRLSRLLIDANWGDSTDIVYKFCRQSQHSALLLPGHGKYVGASSVPWESYRRQQGELLGEHWLFPSVKRKRAVRHVLIDTNYWKSFVHSRLAVAFGDKGCLSLFGSKAAGVGGADHRMFAEHLTAEYRVKTAGRGRELYEWKPKAGKPDNHFLDCLAGCAVAASICGCNLLDASASAAPKGKRLKLSELQTQKRKQRG